MASPEVIAGVRAATSLEGLAREYGLSLRRAPGGWVACCCFHKERTPSLHIHSSGDRSGNYWCFGCGAHGDCFTFIQALERWTFGEALKYLALRAGIPLDDGVAKRRLSPVESAAESEDSQMFRWWADQQRALARAALEKALADGSPTDREEWQWCCCLGRLARYEWKMAEFRQAVSGKDREIWRRHVSREKEFAEAWMKLGVSPGMDLAS